MKKVIVLSGISGSGKSTYARMLMRELPSSEFAVCVSADDFFMRGDPPRYQFNASELSEAHNQCFRSFLDAMMYGNASLVIVDNTNASNEEIAPYMLAATALGYEAEIHTIVPGHSQWECAARNEHGIPLDSVKAQAQRISERRLLPWWPAKTISNG